mmetsp:Transcript_17261/g.59040  ORF Transcript_17261/g.59040 Transcript_17261/m.59040 type:complete len:157 (-) Transcript_17261:439-909(-)
MDFLERSKVPIAAGAALGMALGAALSMRAPPAPKKHSIRARRLWSEALSASGDVKGAGGQQLSPLAQWMEDEFPQLNYNDYDKLRPEAQKFLEEYTKKLKNGERFEHQWEVDVMLAAKAGDYAELAYNDNDQFDSRGYAAYRDLYKKLHKMYEEMV